MSDSRAGAPERSAFRDAVKLFVIAVGINFVWEMAQMPLYVGMAFDDSSSWLECFRASIGDGVIVLSIWGIGIGVFRSRRWFSPFRPSNAAVLIVSGASIAVVIELHALWAGRWAYSALMPTLPVVPVGLSPVVQLLVLPVLSMRVATREKRR